MSSRLHGGRRSAPGDPPGEGLLTGAQDDSPAGQDRSTARTASIAGGSVARFLAGAGGLLFATVASIVTARVLGPSAKGVLASLSFATQLLSLLCTLGLGEAAIVYVGKGKADLQEALSSSLALTLMASVIGVLILLAYALTQLPVGERYVLAAVWTACLTVVVAVVATVLYQMLNAVGRVVATSVIIFVMGAAGAVGSVIGVAIVHLTVLGGMLGNLLGVLMALVLSWIALRQRRLRWWPRLSGAYARTALSFGVRTQYSNVLAFASARLDLLLVYAISGRAEAGYYSVALTLGTVAGFVATSLSYASFPRLSQLPEREAVALTTQLVRVGLAATVPFSIVLAGMVPVVVHLVLPGYVPAVVPGMVLLLGNIFWSGQWLVSRSVAARGDPSLLSRSFLVNVATMVALDLVLVPSLGSLGAALASVVAPAAGLLVCLARLRRDGVPMGMLVPRTGDWRQLARLGALRRAQ